MPDRRKDRVMRNPLGLSDGKMMIGTRQANEVLEMNLIERFDLSIV